MTPKGLTDTPGGPLRNLGCIDDSSWIGTSHKDIQHVASRLHIAGNFTNLFSDATKTVGFSITLQGKRVVFGRQPIQFSSMPLRIPEDAEYIRLLGRHALPNVFHRQDLRTLMASCRRAVAPVSMSTLSAHYLIHIYNAVAGGMQRWSSAIRPPLPRAMRLANLPVASLLRNFWNISADSPPESFLQPIAFGWTGLCSALPTMVPSFVSTYQHQLNHPNPHVRASTRHALLQALTRFHRDMPCVHREILHVCPAHSDDHCLFIIWCHHLSVGVHVPPNRLHMPLIRCPLYHATSEWRVEDAHLWMTIPYHSKDQAIRSRWTVRFCPTTFPVPFSDDISALQPSFPDFSFAPLDGVFIPDASWFPSGRHIGGAVAVLNVHTDHYTLHRIPIPIFCHNSYQAQLYVAWVVLRARASAHWFVRDDRWSLIDSNSYITAAGSRNDSTSPLVTSLLISSRSLVKNTAPPRHLCSHLTGTFLDRVMDAVDGLAWEVGMYRTPGKDGSRSSKNFRFSSPTMSDKYKISMLS